jgi:translation initiation factor 2
VNTTPDAVGADLPQLIQPYAECEYINAARCCKILGCSWDLIARLAEAGEIDCMKFCRCSWKLARYASVAAYCDRLREKYMIEDRRPALSDRMLCHKDANLLPFPLSDTIGAKQACEALGFNDATQLVRAIEERAFEGYQLMANSPWRISLSSLQRWQGRALAGSGAHGGKTAQQIKSEGTKQLNIILKGDVQGLVEVISNVLAKFSNEQVRINVLCASSGPITERDVLMAAASNAIIMGFNVRPGREVQRMAEGRKVDIRQHSIIELQDWMKGK